MPAFTVAHGPLGLEGIHRLADQIDMNTQTGLPRIQLDRITGLHSISEADDNREPTYGQGGEEVYRSLRRGRTTTYEGRILGRTIWELRQLTRDLRYAATTGYLGGGTTIVIRPHPTIGGVSHQITGRVLALEIDDEQTIGVDTMPTPYQREFVLTFRQHDPRFYLVGMDVTVSGSAGAVVAVTNPGNAPAQPVFVVNGPVTGDLTFHRLDNDVERQLVYIDTDLASGQQLRLDFAARTLRRVSDLESFDHHRQFHESNWWDAGAAGLNAGTTQITVEGGGTWSCTFAPPNW